MELGGNKRYQEYLEQYNLNNESANMKYKTRASDYYRELLRREVDGKPFFDQVLSYEEGRIPSETIEAKANSNIGIGSEHYA